MEQYLNVIERRGIDELIIIDIEATAQNRGPDFEKLRRYCNNIFCPVTYGGGISTLDHIQLALENGADKVAIRTGLDIIPKAVQRFGAQAIIGVLDWFGFQYAVEYAEWLESMGVGELLVTDTIKDGTMEGYNLKLINEVSTFADIPVVALGGCGEPAHMHQALLAGASAVAAGSMFLYTEHTPRSCAKYLEEQGIPVRI